MKNVVFQILVNNVDHTSTLKNYLLSIDIENSFNQQLKPGQIVMTFSSNLTYTWVMTNTLRILVWWEDEPSVKFDSGTYYIDKASEDLSTANQNYRVEASQQALDFDVQLNYVFLSDRVYYFTPMMQTILSILQISGYTLPTFNGNASSISISTMNIDEEVTSKFDSPFQVIINSCLELGCVANISSNNQFRMYQIEQLASLPLSFQNNSNRTVLNINNNVEPNLVKKYYKSWYSYYGGGTNTTLQTTTINKKTLYTNQSFTSYCINQLSAARRNVGFYYQNLLDASRVDIDFIGNPRLATGIKFGLGVNYGRFNKEYFASRVVQKISSASWISNVEAIPVDLILPTNLQIESLFDLNDNLQPPPIEPIYSIAIGKFFDATGYDSPSKRLSFFTVERLLSWVRLHSIYGAFPRTFTDTEINGILTPLINECITNRIRQDIAVMYAVIATQGFTRERTSNNIFRMQNQSNTLANNFSSIFHTGSALCQRLTRVGTSRGYVGTPRDEHVSSWTQNGYNSINSVATLSINYVTVNAMRQYLVQMYIEMDIALYGTVDT